MSVALNCKTAATGSIECQKLNQIIDPLSNPYGPPILGLCNHHRCWAENKLGEALKGHFLPQGSSARGLEGLEGRAHQGPL